MQRFMLKSKLHRAKVTEANLNYEGSITIDVALMEAADIVPYEQVAIYDVNNGERFTTYAIEGEKGTGIICLNGAAARKVAVGDLIIIATYAVMEEGDIPTWRPRCILLDGENRIKKVQ